MQRKQYVELKNVRLIEQQEVMEQIVKDAVCPFCTEHLIKYHKRPILKEGGHWLLTENQWPYQHTRNHLLAITRKHLESMEELSPEAMRELIELFRWAITERKMAGGGFTMRFGDPLYSGGSVRHLHAQLIEPDLDDPDYEPVRIKIGKSKDT